MFLLYIALFLHSLQFYFVPSVHTVSFIISVSLCFLFLCSVLFIWRAVMYNVQYKLSKTIQRLRNIGSKIDFSCRPAFTVIVSKCFTWLKRRVTPLRVTRDPGVGLHPPSSRLGSFGLPIKRWNFSHNWSIWVRTRVHLTFRRHPHHPHLIALSIVHKMNRF